MTVTTTDEEAPLLPKPQTKKKVTPLPWGQFSILLILQLAEPLTSNVINPFAPQVSHSAPVFKLQLTIIDHSRSLCGTLESLVVMKAG